MRRIRFILLLLLVGLGLTGYFTLRVLGILGPSTLARPREVPRGDQEIAWLHTATSGSSWERFVAGCRRVEEQWPGLHVDDNNAFPEQTAAVPEVVLSFTGCPGKLRVRWYKLTSEVNGKHWVAELARRAPPPLAIFGGENSDRARDLAQALAGQKEWRGQPPLLLLESATADSVYLDSDSEPRPPSETTDLNPLLVGKPTRPLMDVYPGRSFRFCFTNRQMADAVRDFLWTHPYLWPSHTYEPSLGAVPCSAADPWGSLTLLAAGAMLQQPDVYALDWLDDAYSTDMSQQFSDAISEHSADVNAVERRHILHSIGGYAEPNPPEAAVVRELLARMSDGPQHWQLLVLPATDRPARRILRGLTTESPLAVRNIVAVSGDSIGFNTVYRDRDIAWNVQYMPVPLVFFTHANPVAWSSASPGATREPNATDEELLNADIMQLLLEGAFAGVALPPGRSGSERTKPRLVSEADELRSRLRDRQPAFFGADGNRLGGSGEHVVCLRPHVRFGPMPAVATLEVWSRRSAGPVRGWHLVRRLRVAYPDAAREGSHAGF